MAKVAHASPTKGFFVHMITKDISLEACILDLLDNSLDGARGQLHRQGQQPNAPGGYEGFHVELTLDRERFTISDNCGGIPVEDAVNYAFHFGRREDADPEAPYAIGLYGIGMKRAILKMGETILVHSSTVDEAFSVPINVKKWLRDDDRWDFTLRELAPDAVAGTCIEVRRLYDGIAAEMNDPLFRDDLVEAIARDYSFFLLNGFRIAINGIDVQPYRFALRSGGDFEPINTQFSEDGVEVRLVAGFASPPQDDIEPEARPVMDPDYLGWFVICNDRVVLAADKTKETIWGNEFPVWHPQYNGFMGLAFFTSANPGALPWTTTKRGVDASNPVFRRAQTEMKNATRPFLQYTQQRKESLDAAKAAEANARPTAIADLTFRPAMALPKLNVPRVRLATIQYKRPLAEVAKVAESLGDRNLSFKDVGIRTFEFYLKEFAED